MDKKLPQPATAGVAVVDDSTSSAEARATLPPGRALPERKYFKIGEVAEFIGVEPHVLRYWETQFPQLRPHKARSGHRLYRRREVETLLVIKDLLHVQRFTIAGARQALRQNGMSSHLPRVAQQLTLPPAPVIVARHARVLQSTPPTPAVPPTTHVDVLDEDAEDVQDGEVVDDVDEEGEVELHLAGPLPSRPAQTEVEVVGCAGEELARAMDEDLRRQLAARGGGLVEIELRAEGRRRAAGVREARRLLTGAARDLELLLRRLGRAPTTSIDSGR